MDTPTQWFPEKETKQVPYPTNLPMPVQFLEDVKFPKSKMSSSQPSSLAVKKKSIGYVQPKHETISKEDVDIMAEAELMSDLSISAQQAIKQLPYGSPEREALLTQAVSQREPTYNELVRMLSMPLSRFNKEMARYKPDMQKRIQERINKLVESRAEPIDPESPTRQELMALASFPMSEVRKRIAHYLPPIQEDILQQMDEWAWSDEDVPTYKEPEFKTYQYTPTVEEAREITGTLIESTDKKFFKRVLNSAQQDFNDFMSVMSTKYGKFGYIPDTAETVMAKELGERVNQIKRIGCNFNVDKDGNEIKLLPDEQCEFVRSETDRINARLSANPKRFGHGSEPRSF